MGWVIYRTATLSHGRLPVDCSSNASDCDSNTLSEKLSVDNSAENLSCCRFFPPKIVSAEILSDKVNILSDFPKVFSLIFQFLAVNTYLHTSVCRSASNTSSNLNSWCDTVTHNYGYNLQVSNFGTLRSSKSSIIGEQELHSFFIRTRKCRPRLGCS